MDYRELLKKYIRYVGFEEGTTFINPTMVGAIGFSLNEKEIDELVKLEKETEQEFRDSFDKVL